MVLVVVLVVLTVWFWSCSVKCRATRLCSESELGLRSVLQDPLLLYSQWSQAVGAAMQASADVNDFSHTAVLLQRIEVRHSGSS